MTTDAALPHAHYRRFESFKEYEALLDELIPLTLSVIRVFDRALPPAWNAPARSALLRKFLRNNPANRLHVIVHDASMIVRDLPRVADLARDFGHALKIRQTPRTEQHLHDPFIVFDASHYLHRFHHAHMRAAIGTHDVENAHQLLQRHVDLWEIAIPVSVGSVSGL